MGSLSSQLANQCCCEKSAVYNVKKGTWTSPFEGASEYDSVSNVFTKSSNAPPKGDAPAVVVLVGGTGVGKSNLGNYLLGRSVFESRNSQESVTAVTTWIDGTWFGGRHPVRVVDCTGIGDTKGAYADQKQWDTTIEVLKNVGKVSALVMVMRAGRFTKFDKEVISILRESFGPPFWKNMCVFCTGASAKPQQLRLEDEGPKIRRKLHQIEKEQGGDEAALQAIQKMHVYAADLDPVLASPESRSLEFKFKPALGGLSLEELLALDLKIPSNVMDMSDDEFRQFASSDTGIERWIEGNYFQLGLARLAMFKNDVLSMDPFSPGRLARLADAPEAEKPPPESANDEMHEDIASEFQGASLGDSADGIPPEEHLRYFTDLDSLELALVGEDVVMIRGTYLERVAAENGVLPRRQDLPDDAIFDPTTLINGLQGHENVPTPFMVSLSYTWLTKEHPDPEGFHLQNLAPLLKAFASWNRISTDNIAVFIDWCSLPQAPRSQQEGVAFQRAMQHIHLWYAHAFTAVWLLTRVPEGVPPYQGRGWPQFEKSVSTMINPAESILDMGLLRHSWTSWGQVLQDCRVKALPPAAPETFVTELLRKAFADENDRELLARRYGEAFRGAIGSAEHLPYAGLRWGDREAVRVAKLLPLCGQLKELELQQNDISNKGANALAQNLSQCPELERLCLWGNCMDAEAQENLMQAWLMAGKPAPGLELGDQRKPVPHVEIVTTSSGLATGGGGPASPKTLGSPKRDTGTPGRSPAASRRTPDELAALQMAELGARQAAFEARLHVAINRISSTLSEVSDAVGPTPLSPIAHSSRAASPTASLAPRSSGASGF